MHVKTLILGAGLTGLSTAYHLQKKGDTDYLVVEREQTPGGLCASEKINGFTFDKSGHLLHLHTEYGKKLVKTLLKTNLTRLKRDAWIYTQGSRVPFPFQANLFALPDNIRFACINGLIEAARHPLYRTPKNFEEWCLSSFGRGVYETFMRPYNTKLWGTDPKNLTTDWCGPFVPTPNLDDILQGAQKPPQKAYGYNSYFYYPKQGGCGALVDALVKRVKNLRLNAPVLRVDLTHKTALVGSETITFDHLVSTIALPELLTLLTGEKALSAQAKKLTHTTVTVYNLAINRAVKPFSWIYCPDAEDPFYRVGLQSGFSVANAPAGTSSFYIEIQGKIPHTPAQEKRIWNALVQKGIIEKYDEVLFSFWQTLPYAYAVYNKNRSAAVSQVLTALAARGCVCAGRYGKWEYSFMERSLLEGLEIAGKLV